MFRRKTQRPRDTLFEHSENCPLVRAESGYQPIWNEVESGRWRRECRCGAEGWSAPSSTIALGSTRTTRRLDATSGSANTSARPIPP
jgi:hypothetical protein